MATSSPVTVEVAAPTSATSAPTTVTVLRGATSTPVRVTVVASTPVETDTSSAVTVTVVSTATIQAAAGEVVFIPAVAPNGTISSITLTGHTPAPTINGSGASGTDRWFRAPILSTPTALTFTVTDSAAATIKTNIQVTAAVDHVRWGGSRVRSYRTVITGVGIPTVTPVANFDVSASSGPAPLTVQFFDTSTGVPTSWLWSFSDGTTSTQRNPVKTFPTGTWSVTLTATNSSGSSTVVRGSLINATNPDIPPVDPLTYGGGLYGDGTYGN